MKPWHRMLLALSALGISSLILLAFAYSDTIGKAVFGENNMVYYWSPTELHDAGEKARGATVRLGGMVLAGEGENWDQKIPLVFFITDNKNTVRVSSTGAPPQMFRPGIGVVVEGQLEADDTFHTGRVMVKHSNEYRVPDESEAIDGQAIENISRSLELGS